MLVQNEPIQDNKVFQSTQLSSSREKVLERTKNDGREGTSHNYYCPPIILFALMTLVSHESQTVTAIKPPCFITTVFSKKKKKKDPPGVGTAV